MSDDDNPTQPNPSPYYTPPFTASPFPLPPPSPARKRFPVWVIVVMSIAGVLVLCCGGTLIFAATPLGQQWIADANATSTAQAIADGNAHATATAYAVAHPIATSAATANPTSTPAPTKIPTATVAPTATPAPTIEQRFASLVQSATGEPLSAILIQFLLIDYPTHTAPDVTIMTSEQSDVGATQNLVKLEVYETFKAFYTTPGLTINDVRIEIDAPCGGSKCRVGLAELSLTTAQAKIDWNNSDPASAWSLYDSQDLGIYQYP